MQQALQEAEELRRSGAVSLCWAGVHMLYMLVIRSVCVCVSKRRGFLGQL